MIMVINTGQAMFNFPKAWKFLASIFLCVKDFCDQKFQPSLLSWAQFENSAPVGNEA